MILKLGVKMKNVIKEILKEIPVIARYWICFGLGFSLSSLIQIIKRFY